jgi:molybdate transport system substrate-binding protein
MPKYVAGGLAVVALLICACGGAMPSASAGLTPPVAATAAPLGGKLTIFAAASLTESFNAIAAEFRKENPLVTIAANYGGSAALVGQIAQGAEADLFASADEANMQKLVDAKLNAGDPKIFANNRLQIVVQAGNPKRIAQLSDLARPDVILVLGASSVPVGVYALQALEKAGVKVAPKSLEIDTKLVVAKVALGEADAGVVYSTDVKAGGPKIQGVDIPDQFNVTAKYPIAVVKGTTNAAAANAFVDFVRSAKGRELLASFGFILP